MFGLFLPAHAELSFEDDLYPVCSSPLSIIMYSVISALPCSTIHNGCSIRLSLVPLPTVEFVHYLITSIQTKVLQIVCLVSYGEPTRSHSFWTPAISNIHVLWITDWNVYHTGEYTGTATEQPLSCHQHIYRRYRDIWSFKVSFWLTYF